MRQMAIAIYLIVIASSAGLTSSADRGEQAPAGPVLLVPGAKGAERLRLDLAIDGQPPAAAWDAFLDRLFTWFDRDGDGSLSRAETSRMLPLPIAGRSDLKIDFDSLDADGDGRGRRPELKAFCRRNGYTPVVVVVEPSSDDDRRLEELFHRQLDANGDKKVTRAELQRAPELLRKYDLNDDEFLDQAELLGSSATASRPGPVQVRLGETGGKGDMVLHLDVGTKTRGATIDGKSAKSIQLEIVPDSDGLHRLRSAEGCWSMALRTTRTAPTVLSAGEFLVSQFKMALGDQATLAKAELERDAALSGLLELFPYADRNGDNRLSLAELEAFLQLVELGLRAQIWIQVTDRGRNPFHFLDVDGDGRLSYRELARASDLLKAGAGRADRLPMQFQLAFGGPSTASWGGVPIPSAAKRPRPRMAVRYEAPRWFQAMDRNGDGVVSPREFVGPPELFRKLDANGDGVISFEEAVRSGDR